MLAKKTFMHAKLKNRAICWNYLFALCICLLGHSCNAGTENLTNFPYTQQGLAAALSAVSSSKSPAAATSSSLSSTSGASANTANAGTRTVLRIYDECSHSVGGFVPCLKKKAISFIDRISHIDAITVADGIKLVRLPNSAVAAAPLPLQPLYSENELEPSLSRSSDDRDTKLTNMLIERLSYFFNGHTLQVNFPKLTAEEIGRGLEEGRGKMKKMMSMMMMGVAMKMIGMLPVAMGMLYMMAGKALIVSKIALLLAGMMGLKKLMNGRGGGSGGSAGWSSGGGGGGGWSSGGGGGYDRRSLNEAHELAYRGYSNRQPTGVYSKQKQAQQPNFQQQPQQQEQHQHQQKQQQQPLSLQQQQQQVQKS
ncbi:uncharacterized protein LOC105212398 [Zeugodacus cucurbitae]|uniref:Uncharacterized protein n=1 Tax=Zeugodacus cucurbitae TaxID=28588 RepID=A0A0A1WVZ0_ZEUCU|nr:uncharacterized protein LOC105212398 [Zeugodacus cucurbitae]